MSVNDPLQAKQDLLRVFESLPQDERDAILGSKGTAKFPSKESLSEAKKSAGLVPDTSKGSLDVPRKQQKKEEDEENDIVRF